MERSSLEQLEFFTSQPNYYPVRGHREKVSKSKFTTNVELKFCDLSSLQVLDLNRVKEISSRQHLPKKQFQLPPVLEFADKNPVFRHRLLVFSGVILVAFLPILLIRSILLSRTKSAGNLPYYDCTYSGNFTLQGIDLPFGEMTFAQAKAIDLMWNTLVGRGLQILLSIASYRTLVNTLTLLAETSGVTYELYSVLAFSSTTFQSILVLGKAVLSKIPLRGKFSLAWLLISMVYLLSFPTLMDALSGYQAMQSTVLKLPNNQNVDLSQGLKTTFTTQIHFNSTSYGTRNLPPLPETSSSLTWLGSLEGVFRVEADSESISFIAQTLICGAGENLHGCPLSPAGSPYTICINESMAELHYTNETTLNPPVIILTYDDSSCGVLYYMLQDPVTQMPGYPKTHWNFELLKNQGNYQCVAQHKYQWGFSYAWLLITSCINAVWCIGSYVVWLDAERHSELAKKGREGGTWRALLDLADAVFDNLGPDTCAYTNREIAEELSGQTRLRYCVKTNEDGSANIRLRSVTDKSDAEKKFVLNWHTDYGR